MDKRKLRQNVSAFATLVAQPASGAFSMPAPCRVFFKSVAGCADGTTCGTLAGAYRDQNPESETYGDIVNRTIKTAELAEGGLSIGHYAERAVTVTPAAGFDVYIDAGLGRLVLISEG